MNKSKTEKNRTVKTQSTHQVNVRTGRKIPKEVFKSETQACNTSNSIELSANEINAFMQKIFSHEHVLDEATHNAVVASLTSLRGENAESIRAHYLQD